MKSRKSKKDPIYQLGDLVKIVKPDLYKRTGYKLGLEDGLKFVEENEPQIRGALYSLELDEELLDFYIKKSNTTLRKVLAYLFIKHNEFGGCDRMIHTENKPELQDKIYKVDNKKVVRTGTKEYGDSEDGGNYLGEVKSHVILKLYPNVPTGDFCSIDDSIEIEEKNVTKIKL